MAKKEFIDEHIDEITYCILALYGTKPTKEQTNAFYDMMLEYGLREIMTNIMFGKEHLKDRDKP